MIKILVLGVEIMLSPSIYGAFNVIIYFNMNKY